MCRIAGMYNRGINKGLIETYVAGMCNTLAHGGPDDEGIYVSPDAPLVLGNRRLALIDLSDAGHQPMCYEDRYWITYNGELYNYPELKTQLVDLGHRFKSKSDTEVVLAAYSQWGTQSFARFKGMFAIAIWDSVQQELILARDATGIKPLYYSRENNGIAFASEVKALMLVPALQEMNPNWQVYLMAYGHLPEPVTTLKSVYPLPKGCFLTYKANECRFLLQSFKHYSYHDRITDESTAIDAIREQLSISVKRHLLADAPLGIFLSGGVDSGILGILASESKQEKLNALSIYFDDPVYSEKKYQDIIASKINCTNTQFLLGETEFLECFPSIFGDMDMPCSDGVNTWFISRYAKQLGLKAVLSGIGGDELFGGYPSFNRMRLTSLLQVLPALSIRSVRKSGIKQLNRLSYLNMEGIKGVYLFLRGHFTPSEIARQLDCSEQQVWNLLNDEPVFQEATNLPLKEKASWMEWHIYMQNQLLRDADVMGMAHGVEIRVPYLDDDFVKLVFSISPAIKYKNGSRLKPLLIDAFTDKLPREIWDRPKMGFSFPFADWLKRSDFVKDRINHAGGTSQDNYQKFENGQLHWSQMMSLIMINNVEHAV